MEDKKERRSYDAHIAVIKNDIKHLNGKVDRILKFLEGNEDSEKGLVTKVALNRQSIRRLMGWLTIISIAILALFGKAILGG